MKQLQLRTCNLKRLFSIFTSLSSLLFFFLNPEYYGDRPDTLCLGLGFKSKYLPVQLSLGEITRRVKKIPLFRSARIVLVR